MTFLNTLKTHLNTLTTSLSTLRSSFQSLKRNRKTKKINHEPFFSLQNFLNKSSKISHKRLKDLLKCGKSILNQ